MIEAELFVVVVVVALMAEVVSRLGRIANALERDDDAGGDK